MIKNAIQRIPRTYDESVIIEKAPDKEEIVGLVKELNIYGHHIPLSVLASIQCNADTWTENYMLYKYIRFESFENLIGKRLFGIQPIEGCSSCMYPLIDFNNEETNKDEHDVISDILEKSLFISFFSPKDEYELWRNHIVEFAEDYLTCYRNNEYKSLKYAIDSFASVYREFDFSWLKNECTTISEEDFSNSDIHPRLWLFVGDSVLSFESYLLFNSNHGHPHMDNWYLVNWKLSQPPATESFKMVGHNIQSINVHDTINNKSENFTMKANFDEWMKYCGMSDDGYKVPSEKYYPILEIDASTKIIQLGTKWHSCHYPISLYNFIDT